MSRQDRMRLIAELEAQRDSRLLVAVWGDRQNLTTQIASDVHAIVFEHLERMGKVRKIDVLLYTTGGQTLAAWSLANMVREYCDELAVLIPHRALSAGTLFTLAADEIAMSGAGQLSPIDPSLISPLGPVVQTPNQPGVIQAIPISVEDVVGFIDLAAKQVQLKEEHSMLAVFDRLSQQVHPLALGAVYRTREQIVALADRLLSFHMEGEQRKEERESIVNKLTRELGSHDYLIGRTEARNFLKLNVITLPEEEERRMLALFDAYSLLLDLRTPFNADGFLGADAARSGEFTRAVVETSGLTHAFRTRLEIQRAPQGVLSRATFDGWVADQNL